MTNLKKNFKFFLFVSLAFLSHGLFAWTVDTSLLSFNILDLDSAHQRQDFARIDFCNCNGNQFAPMVARRDVNISVLEKFRSKPEFQYERTIKDEATSFWSSFWSWLAKKLFGNISEDNTNESRNFVFWLIGIFFTILVSYWLYKSDFLGSPMRRTAKIDQGLFEEIGRSDEDIESQIMSALVQRDYPLAIRWVYIKCIKNLADENEIEIQQNKTNYDYILEIKSYDQRVSFSELTRLYEFTNYGRFTTNEDHYQKAQSISKAMLNKR